MLASTAVTTTTTAKIGGTINRVATSNLPRKVILGIRFLWRFASIFLLNTISRPGIKVNTDSKLNRIALISTVAISRPMPKCMNAKAPKPEMVVREEELISGIALDNAAIQASRVSLVSCSSEKRWHRMMA